MQKFKVIRKKEGMDLNRITTDDRMVLFNGLGFDTTTSRAFDYIFTENINNVKTGRLYDKIVSGTASLEMLQNINTLNPGMLIFNTQISPGGTFEYNIRGRTFVSDDMGKHTKIMETGTVLVNGIIIDSEYFPYTESMIGDSIIEFINRILSLIVIDPRRTLDVFHLKIPSNSLSSYQQKTEKVPDIIAGKNYRQETYSEYYRYDSGIYDEVPTDFTLKMGLVGKIASDDSTVGVLDDDLIGIIEKLKNGNVFIGNIENNEYIGTIYTYFFGAYQAYVGKITADKIDESVLDNISFMLKLYTTMLYLVYLSFIGVLKINPENQLARDFMSIKENKKLDKLTYHLEYVQFIASIIYPGESKKFSKLIGGKPIITLKFIYTNFIDIEKQVFASTYDKPYGMITHVNDQCKIYFNFCRKHNLRTKESKMEFDKKIQPNEARSKTLPLRYVTLPPSLDGKIPWNYKGIAEQSMIRYQKIAEEMSIIGPKEKEKMIPKSDFEPRKVNTDSDSTGPIRDLISLLNKNYIKNITEKMLYEFGIPWNKIHDDHYTREDFLEYGRLFINATIHDFCITFGVKYDFDINISYDIAKTNLFKKILTSGVSAKEIGSWLMEKIKFSSVIDVSDVELQGKKIKNEMIKQARTNAFLNLTPEFKIQIGFDNFTPEQKENFLDNYLIDRKKKLDEIIKARN